MRDVLIHAYDTVDVAVVRTTVTSDLPPLIEALEGLEPADADD